MNDLKTISDIVKNILSQDTQARNDDNHLYLRVLQHISSRKGIDIQTMTVPAFLMGMKRYGLPGFETVRRSRQKVQADNPELAGSEAVRRKRSKQETVYREFAASEV